jgi:subtilisin family serine protease
LQKILVLIRVEEKIESLYDSFGISSYHAMGIKGQGVKIMIIDTGMPDSAPSFASLPKSVKHGVAVSSILTGSNDFKGICPEAEVELLDVKDTKNIPISKVLRAMEMAIDNGVDIISISLGTTDSWEPMQELISKAENKNILVFAAAGNSGERGYEYPAACKGAISVASMNTSRQPSPFNTRNDATVVFAPGEDLSLPVGQSGELGQFSGTSFATPFAAGLAALVLAEHRSKTPTKQFITRKDMILLLRDFNHLGLNCDTHTYVMEPTCTETRYENREGISQPLNLKLIFVLCLVLLLFVSQVAYACKT